MINAILHVLQNGTETKPAEVFQSDLESIAECPPSSSVPLTPLGSSRKLDYRDISKCDTPLRLSALGPPSATKSLMGGSILRSKSRPEGKVDLSIFKSPALRREGHKQNRNTFSRQSMSWIPSVKRDQSKARYQTATDLAIAKRMNAIFYS